MPPNAFMLSNHNGFSASIDSMKYNKKYNLDFMQYPANITYQRIKYNKFSISMLNYGTMYDQIDNLINKKFNAFEIDVQYLYKKKIQNKFLILGAAGITYSQIHNVNSSGLTSNLKILSKIKKYNIAISLSINNLGLVLDSYTNHSNYFPLQYQLGTLYRVPKTSIQLGYDIIYHKNSQLYQRIYCINFPLGQLLKFRLSSHNWREKLLINNYKEDWFYGLGYGLSINTKKTIFDIGVSNLGSSGFVYAISVGFKNN